MGDGGKADSGVGAVEAADLDRRIRQRFIARRHGQPCFWLRTGGERVALDDLSLEGFSAPMALPPRGEFDVVLQREGVPDEIRCTALVVNEAPGPSGSAFGCRFAGLSSENAERLQDWLVAHVIMSATIRITEKDAVMIVKGRSLV